MTGTLAVDDADSDGAIVDQALTRRFRAIANACGYILVALGVIVLLGWLVRSETLTSVDAALASMKPNTALAFVLGGASLSLAHGTGSRARRSAIVLASVSTLIGAVTLLEYAFGWNAGIDQLLFSDPNRLARAPGRMSPITATMHLLLGSALMLDQPRRPLRFRPSEWLTLMAGASAFVALLGYVYGVRSLYAVAPFASVALHTASGFIVYAFGILASRPDQGIVMPLVTSDGPAGVLSRRLLPVALVIPPFFGWLRLLGQRAGLYGTEFGLALFAASNVLCISTFIVWTAGILRRSDALRRRAEARSRANEESLAITLNSIGDGVIATDARGWITRMNPVAEQLTGFSETLARGRPLHEVFHIIHQETRTRAESPVERVLREGAIVGLANHTALIARDGTERPIADSGAPIRDASNEIRGVVLVFRDIAEKERSEAALRISEERYRTQFEAAPEAIVTLDVDQGSFVEANENAERLFAHPRAELYRLNPIALSPPQQPDGRSSQEAARIYIERALAGEQPVFEWTHRNAEGRDIPCEIRLVRLPGDGRLCRGSILDISERKRAQEATRQLEATLRETQEQLSQSQKMDAVGRLAAGVAHDFNNLLSVILGYGELILSEVAAQDPLREHLTQIAQASERAAKLTSQLLAFSRQQVLSTRVVDLNQVVRELAEMLERMIGEDIELKLTLQAQSCVRVDPSQVQQVIMNLVVNARDAMPSGGRLAIETADVDLDPNYTAGHLDIAPGHYVMLAVHDTGCGMDKATRDRIFEPFFTTKGVGKGTGLGLSTVFGIVKQSGGDIWVYSELGAGTAFKIYFPRSMDLAEPSATTARAAQKLGGNETVLLVEDDEQVRGLARTILSKHGYHVLEAANADDALCVCQQFSGEIDLVLTDVVMPRMSGRELAERIAQLQVGIHVVYMSGYTDDALLRDGRLGSGAAFVQKPLLPEALLVEVRRVLDAGGIA